MFDPFSFWVYIHGVRAFSEKERSVKKEFSFFFSGKIGRERRKKPLMHYIRHICILCTDSVILLHKGISYDVIMIYFYG